MTFSKHINVWLGVIALFAASCSGDCSGQSTGDVDDLVVEGLEYSAIEVTVGEPFELEARVFEADGTPASDYSWRWSIDSYGHTEDASTMSNTERVVLTPTVADQIWVYGEVGRRDSPDDPISWRSVRGPQLLAWGGEPASLYASADAVTLAVGERRPVLFQGVATRLNKGQSAQEAGAGHDPTELASSDPSIVSVTENGLLEAHAAGSATVTATYGEFSTTVDVTVDADLVMGPPIQPNPAIDELKESDGQTSGGFVDDSGYPTFVSKRIVSPGNEFHMRVPALARWTGTGYGFEAVHRPFERKANFDKVARGTDGNLWVAYHNNKFAPFGYIVVAHRPIDGGPDDWVYREVDLVELLGGDLEAFDPIHNVGMRAKPDGGVWLVLGGKGELAVPEDSGVDGRFSAFVLADITTSAMSAEILVTEAGGEPLEFGGELYVRQSGDAQRPDILGLPIGDPPTLLTWEAQRQQWIPTSPVSPEYELPTSLRFHSLVQALDEDDPAKPSRLIMTMVQDPTPSKPDGEGLAIVLPEDRTNATPDAAFEYDWRFKRGYASIRGDELYFVTDAGTPIWQHLMVDESQLLGYSSSQLFTTVDQFGNARPNGFDNAFADGFRGWAFGAGFIFRPGGSVRLSEYEHPLLARDAATTGRFLGYTLRNRPVAFDDGRVLWSALKPNGGGKQFLAALDELSGQVRSHESGSSIFLEQALDLRVVDGVLMALMADGEVYESIDEGENWLFAGGIDELPVNPWALVDGAGNRHTLEYDGDFVWEWFAPGATEPTQTKRLPTTEPNYGCAETGEAFLKTVVTSTGSIIRCTSEAPHIRYLFARPEDDAWIPLGVALNGAGNTVGNTMFEPNRWVTQVVELADGRVIFGFTGKMKDSLQSRAMLVEMSADGQLSAPHVLRPDGGYGQEFRSMEQLPDGGLLVVLRDHGVPDINARAGVDLIVRVDELSPDEELLQHWIQEGLERP